MLCFLVAFVLRFPLLPYYQLVFKFDTGIWLYKSNISIQQQVFLCCISLEANAQNFRKLFQASKIASCSSHYKPSCNKLFDMKMCCTPVLLFYPKLCCKFSFDGFLPSTVPYLNKYKTLISHYNQNTYNVVFVFSRAELREISIRYSHNCHV